MRVVSWNVNGLRAAIRKGIDNYILELNPDVLMLQEVRAYPEQLPSAWREKLSLEGWSVIWHPAEKKGYSGVATLTKGEHIFLHTGINGALDTEGRVLAIQKDGWRFVNVYVPSGSSGEKRQEVKDTWINNFSSWTSKLVSENVPTIIGGDLNIAHTERDIWNAKSNSNTSGFLPHERLWFNKWLEQGWSDSLREHCGDVQGPYSWWSNRGRARELDRGWRIDYLLVNPASKDLIVHAEILRQGGLEISDHAPVIIDIDIK